MRIGKSLCGTTTALALACGVALGAGASQASATQIAVNACGSFDQGNVSGSPWSSPANNAADFVSSSNCSSAQSSGPGGTGLIARSAQKKQQSSCSNCSKFWTFSAPSGWTIAQVNYTGYFHTNASDGWTAGWISDSSDNLDGGGTCGSIGSGTWCDRYDWSTRSFSAPANTHWLRASVQCSNFFGGCLLADTNNYPEGILNIWSVQVILNDPGPFSVGFNSGGNGNLNDLQSSWISQYNQTSYYASWNASDPAGICHAWGTLDGASLGDHVNQGPNTLVMANQCPQGGTYTDSVQVGNLSNGTHTLTANAVNPAAYEGLPGGSASASIHFNVDNTPPTTSFSGPTGWQHGAQTATANASTSGPSGVAGQACAVDNGNQAWYGGSSAQVTVTGTGVHHVTCTPLSNSGAPGTAVGYEVDIDDTPPTSTFSGPGAGWQHGTQAVTASASTTGPSGVREQDCTIDGAPHSYPGASTQLKVSGTGTHQLTCTPVSNAGVQGTAVNYQVKIDDTPPTSTLSGLGTGWQHGTQTVTASASTTGPSGVREQDCTIDRALNTYPGASTQLKVSGSGTHQLTCTPVSNAGVQGTAVGYPVRIDDTPPGVLFEPENPSDPTALTVDTADGLSGVQGGSIEMRPASGGSWQALSAQFDGSHLLAHFDDSGLSGAYQFQANSCDQAGNCASGTTTLTLPVRLASSESASFSTVKNPLHAAWATERVKVGWHWATIREHGKTVRMKRGGHYRTIRVLIYQPQCTKHTVKFSPHKTKVQRICQQPQTVPTSSQTVPYGTSTTVHGMLLTHQSAPIAGGRVRILTAPDNGQDRYTPLSTVTTANDGSWSALIPAGPSRLVEGMYDGTATTQGSVSQVTLTVPAKIDISITPRTLPWTGEVTIHGQLQGGYIPPDGVALRLLIHLPRLPQPYSPLPLRTDATGAFTIRWSFKSGLGVASYPFSVATTANESDYPFAASESPALPVTFGHATPPPAHRRQRGRAHTKRPPHVRKRK